MNTLVLDAAETSENEVWAHLNEHPIDSERKRLLVVHGAERLEHLDRLVSWLNDNQTTRSRNAVAVFVSTEPEFTAEERTVLQKSSVAMLVRCTLPKDPEDRLKRAAEIVTRWGPADPSAATVLVRRVNGDMREALALVKKVSLYPNGRLTPAIIEALAPRRADADVVVALLALDKRAAAQAVVEGVETSAGWIIGTLASHVETLGRMKACSPGPGEKGDGAQGRSPQVRMPRVRRQCAGPCCW